MRKDFLLLDNNKKVLVTGAAGFIGFHLSKFLLEKGIQIIGFDVVNDYYDVNLKYSRLEILNKYENFNFIKGDLADMEALNVFLKHISLTSW